MATVRDKPRPATGYDDDFHAWALEQATLLRERRLDRLDLDNIAEELEGLASSQVSELRKRYTTLLLHLLKWEFQPERRTRSWVRTIVRERGEIEIHLEDNRTLKPRRDELYGRAFRLARLGAAYETNKSKRDFPAENPYALTQAMDHDFWPGRPRTPDDEPED